MRGTTVVFLWIPDAPSTVVRPAMAGAALGREVAATGGCRSSIRRT